MHSVQTTSSGRVGPPATRVARPLGPALTPRPRSSSPPRWNSGAAVDAHNEAELLELLAWEFYLIDRLDDAITACRRAMRIRQELGESAAVSADHHSLSVYQWYNANRDLAEEHATAAITVLDAETDDAEQLVQLGQAFAMQAYLAVQATDLDRADTLISRAREIADRTGDSALTIRVRLIENYGVVLNGDDSGREEILSILNSAPKHIDELYSGGWSNITYFDVEQRRLDVAADLLDISIPLTREHDLPICRVWQLGSRARLQLMVGEWDDATADADLVLDGPSAPLARTWPSLIRALVALRRNGAGADCLDDAWQLACRFGEPIRMLPVAAAIVERVLDHRRPRRTDAAVPRPARPTDPLPAWSGRVASWRSGCVGSARPSTRSASPIRIGCFSTGRMRRQPMSSTVFRCRTTLRSH